MFSWIKLWSGAHFHELLYRGSSFLLCFRKKSNQIFFVLVASARVSPRILSSVRPSLFVENLTEILASGGQFLPLHWLPIHLVSSPKPLKGALKVQKVLNYLKTWSTIWRHLVSPPKCKSSFFRLEPIKSHTPTPAHPIWLFSYLQPCP